MNPRCRSIATKPRHPVAFSVIIAAMCFAAWACGLAVQFHSYVV